MLRKSRECGHPNSSAILPLAECPAQAAGTFPQLLLTPTPLHQQHYLAAGNPSFPPKTPGIMFLALSQTLFWHESTTPQYPCSKGLFKQTAWRKPTPLLFPFVAAHCFVLAHCGHTHGLSFNFRFIFFRFSFVWLVSDWPRSDWVPSMACNTQQCFILSLKDQMQLLGHWKSGEGFNGY